MPFYFYILGAVGWFLGLMVIGWMLEMAKGETPPRRTPPKKDKSDSPIP